MMKKLVLAGTAMLLAMPVAARAQFTGQTCNASDVFSVTVTGCYGFLNGNDNSSSPADRAIQNAALDFLLGTGHPSATTVEQNNYGDGTSTLNFTTTMYGTTVVGFHWGGGNSYTGNSTAFYKFDAGTAGINSLTLGSVPHDMSKAISNGAIYSTGVSTVPEPSTYLLLASGLGGLGIFGRRRRQA